MKVFKFRVTESYLRWGITFLLTTVFFTVNTQKISRFGIEEITVIGRTSVDSGIPTAMSILEPAPPISIKVVDHFLNKITVRKWLEKPSDSPNLEV